VANDWKASRTRLRSTYHAEPVESFRMIRGDFESLVITVFCSVNLPGSQLCGRQLNPSFSGGRLKQRKALKFLDRRGGITLLQVNTTQIITGRGEVITQNERMFVGPDSVGPLAGPMISEPQMIPSLGVLGQEFDSSFEPLDGKDIMAFPNQTLSFQKRTWTCRHTTGRQESGKAYRDQPF